MSVGLVPLIHMYSMPIIYDALIATSVTVGGLGAVAWNAPSEQFLNWGGPLALGLGGLVGCSLLSILYPQSKALYNIGLYGGLALFSALLLYDTQRIMSDAKTMRVYDPINSSISVYMDSINLFIRFV
jgi:FtsH-binding integral membrane protein